VETCIVIPCYNEANRLDAQAFIDYCVAHSETDFLFVNDGSRDGTGAMLAALAEHHLQLHFLDLPRNAGKAEAVRSGILYATETFSPAYVGFWDADLATPLETIETFVAQIKQGNYDAVTGLRLTRLGASVRRRHLRHYTGRLFATAAAIILGIEVYDTQCGAKLFRADKTLLFAEKFVSRWFFDIEIIARYIKKFGREIARRKICEYPLSKWEDVKGSQLKASDFLKVPIELLKIRRHYR
jgi:glycosyltransferase involved in cell wall biosynthesis